MLKPLLDQVMIKPDKSDDITKSGIISTNPDKSKEVVKGEVIAVGSDVKGIEAGDIVYYNKHVPHKLDIDGTIILVVMYKEIKIKEIKKK